MGSINHMPILAELSTSDPWVLVLIILAIIALALVILRRV